jgi:uncharacterized protein
MKIDLPRERITEFCEKWKITEFELFGSVLREDFGPESDIDVLITFDPDANWGLSDLVQMDEEATAIFGRRVDLVERRLVERSANYLRRDGILGLREFTSRDPAYLLDMLLAARQVVEMLTGVTREEFLGNDMMQSAAMWSLEKLDRAASGVSAELRRLSPEVPWEKAIGLRSRLEDEHFRIDAPAVWEVVHSDLPLLLAAIEPLIPPEEAV